MSMFKRAMILLAAVIVSALVLLWAFFVDPPQTQPPQRGPLTPIDQQAPALDPSAAVGTQRRLPVGFNEAYKGRWFNEKGQLHEVFGATLKPKPRGVSEVDWPGARVYLSPSRVLEIRAQHGIFWVPDLEPRRGEFDSPTVMTLFEGPAGRAVMLGDASPDIRLRMFMENAQFDLDLGKIDSSGSIHLTSPGMDFHGSRMRMVYNPQSQRIDVLEVSQFKSLRLSLRPEARSANASTTRPAATASATPKSQYYRARFDRKVRIEGRQFQSIEGQRLSVIFSGDESDRPGIDRLSRRTPLAPGAVSYPSDPRMAMGLALLTQALNQTSQALDATLAPQTLPTPASLMGEDPNDIIITGGGSLIVEPEPNPPPELVASGGALVELVGEPLRIITREGEKITAGAMAYLTRNGRVRFSASKQTPVTIEVPSLGVVTAPRLDIDQDQHTATFTGPGLLQENRDPNLGLLLEPTTPVDGGVTGRLPPGTTIAWKDKLSLRLAEAPATTQGSHRDDLLSNRALESVAFEGDVRVASLHPSFELNAQHLNLHVTRSAEGKEVFDRILAKGGARMSSRDDKGQPQFALDAQTMDIGLKQGQIQRLDATDQVRAMQPDQTLEAGRMSIEFAAGRPGSTHTAPAGLGTQGLEVAKLTAHDNVKVEITGRRAQENLVVYAQHLEGTPSEGRIVLDSAAPLQARVVRADGQLRGQRIVLGINAQKPSVQVQGPGDFLFHLAQNKAAGKPATAPAAMEQMKIAWQGSMSMDRALGQAVFEQQVHANALGARDTMDLSSEKLTIEFILPPKTPEARPARVATPQPAGAGAEEPTLNDLRSLTAEKNVTFQATSWVDKPQGVLANRLTIKGQIMSFDKVTELVKVVGGGTMLVEEQRRAKAQEGEQDRVFFTGQGRSFFRWSGYMLINALGNDIDMDENVAMLHQPVGQGRELKLDCHHLKADLEATGGLDSWLSGKVEPTLVQVIAERGPTPAIHITHGEVAIRTGRMLFMARNKTITLNSDPPELTQITHPDWANPVQAQEILWDLQKNAFEIANLSPVFVPIGR